MFDVTATPEVETIEITPQVKSIERTELSQADLFEMGFH